MITPFTTGFTQELVKLAYGCPMPMEMSDSGACTWSDRFKGTPMHEVALQLEEQEAGTMLQIEEQQMAEREQDMQREKSWQVAGRARDHFRLQKKRLELQLLQLQRQGAGESREQGWQDLDFVGKPQAPGSPPPQQQGAAPAPAAQQAPAPTGQGPGPQ